MNPFEAVWAVLNPKRAFPVTVKEFSPGERMVWSGGMPLGLFRGVRTFTLTQEGGSTRFEFARGLKQRTEHG
jgi:hypothetical protein